MMNLMINKHSILLRDIKAEDAMFLMELNNNIEIARCVVGNPKQITLPQQLLWMENLKQEVKTKRFIIEYDGVAAGTIIISDIDLINLTANLSIKLHPSKWGKGIGKCGVNLALNYCFKELKVFCVTAHVIEYNKASQALLNSCGFMQEGILRSRVIKGKDRYNLISFSIIYDDFIRRM